jgi:hypothetical protein
VACVIAVFARSYRDAGSWKSLPLEPSIPVTGAPTTAARRNSPTAAANTRRVRFVASVVNRLVMVWQCRGEAGASGECRVAAQPGQSGLSLTCLRHVRHVPFG